MIDLYLNLPDSTGGDCEFRPISSKVVESRSPVSPVCGEYSPIVCVEPSISEVLDEPLRKRQMRLSFCQAVGIQDSMRRGKRSSPILKTYPAHCNWRRESNVVMSGLHIRLHTFLEVCVRGDAS